MLRGYEQQPQMCDYLQQHNQHQLQTIDQNAGYLQYPSGISIISGNGGGLVPADNFHQSPSYSTIEPLPVRNHFEPEYAIGKKRKLAPYKVEAGKNDFVY
jgi:hypothetical protein